MTTFGGAGGSFGPNAWLVDDMYERFLADPTSVSDSWREFFADYRPAPVPAPQAQPPAAVQPVPPEATAPARPIATPPPATTTPAPTPTPTPAPAPITETLEEQAV